MWRYIPNNTISSLAELLRDSISLVDDEVLVEDLEDLAALKISHVYRFALVGSSCLGSDDIGRRTMVSQRRGNEWREWLFRKVRGRKDKAASGIPRVPAEMLVKDASPKSIPLGEMVVEEW